MSKTQQTAAAQPTHLPYCLALAVTLARGDRDHGFDKTEDGFVKSADFPLGERENLKRI